MKTIGPGMQTFLFQFVWGMVKWSFFWWVLGRLGADGAIPHWSETWVLIPCMALVDAAGDRVVDVTWDKLFGRPGDEVVHHEWKPSQEASAIASTETSSPPAEVQE